MQMKMLYDTRNVHPLDRYDYYQAASATEVAPVAVNGRAPGRLLAVMSMARIGDLELEHVTVSADAQLVCRRTQRLIQARDPECYRVFLCASGLILGKQEDRPVPLRANDMTLFDLSKPCDSTHGTEPTPMQAIMLSIPRSQVPVPRAAVRPLTSTHVPRSLPGRSLITQFLLGLDPTLPAPDPALEDVLRESITGLIQVWLGLPSGISPHTRQTLRIAYLSNLIRRHLGDPGLNLEQLARAAHLSPRSLNQLFHDSDLTPMRLVKQLRLHECHRSLMDPTTANTPIKDLITAHGYLRPDQFARDFKQQFGITASQARVRHTR
ncbi:helix-turn-helix domain-containing protein [Actinokineospora sp. 24-640]